MMKEKAQSANRAIENTKPFSKIQPVSLKIAFSPECREYSLTCRSKEDEDFLLKRISIFEKTFAPLSIQGRLKGLIVWLAIHGLLPFSMADRLISVFRLKEA